MRFFVRDWNEDGLAALPLPLLTFELILSFQTRGLDHYTKTPYLEKPWSLIHNQSNNKDEIQKNNFNYTKVFKLEIAIKRIRIKIEIQNKVYIWLTGEIEKRN